MAALVDLIEGLDAVGFTETAKTSEFAPGDVTAVVTFGSPAFVFDTVEHQAYQVNLDVMVVAVDDTVAAAHDRLAAVMHEVSRLWWTEAGRTLSGRARRTEWSTADEFALGPGSMEGRQEVSAVILVAAIIDNGNGG